RGYVNHKVTVNYGLDSEADGTYVSISGPNRLKLMMNFSNLTFFNPRYSEDDDGNSIKDSSMGGVAAYGILAEMDFVDATRMAVSGHSMGTWSSWTVAAGLSGAVNGKGEDISPKATVIQCGELFTDDVYNTDDIRFNNVLLLQAKYDEFNYFRDYADTVTDDLLKTPLRADFLGCTPETAAWDTTFGSFSDGTARRIELLYTNHRLTTHDAHGMRTALDWFESALSLDAALLSSDQVFMAKEALVFAAMLLALAAMLPLMELLLLTPFFASVRQPLPARPEKVNRGWKWWRGALITILIAGATYPFMTQLGHGLLPLPEGVFRMTIGNGFLAWYLLLILVMLLTTVLSFKKAKKKGAPLDYYDIGLSREANAARIDWALCGKAALLALCMTGLVYVLVVLSELCFKLDFRFIWPFFKGFTAQRIGQFFVYIPVFALFFLLNNSKIFASMRQEAASVPGFKGFMACWWKNALCMAGGVILIILLEYIPFFMGIGPGADLLFGSTFGGPFMSLMIVFVPQVLAFSVLCTYIYRRTGSVYTGAFTVATLACWIVTGGSAML
ncbi:MAG: hypothetical protein PHC80_05425, partial [Eubacteriales bacterium]|nr:hypothetical protein [Eubacteriales bacterium]